MFAVIVMFVVMIMAMFVLLAMLIKLCILQAGGTYTKDGSPQSFGLQTVGPLHSLWSVGPTWKVPGEVTF